MIPHFSDLGQDPGLVRVPPPPHFRPLSGTPRHVSFKPTIREPSKGLTSAQRSGLRYEAKAQIWLQDRLGIAYHVAPYLHFRDGPTMEARTCIPDGIYFGVDGSAIVFEIKSQHCPEAWWQLRRLYQPVLKELGRVRHVAVVEVTRSLDPMMPFPEPIHQIASLVEWVQGPPDTFGVLVWRP